MTGADSKGLKLGDNKANHFGSDLALEVFLPDVCAKRKIKVGPTAGLTHRKLLPTLPRHKVAGSRFLESSVHLNTPCTRRPQLDFSLPLLPKSTVPRSSSCAPMMSHSTITATLNDRMEHISHQISRAKSVSAAENAEEKDTVALVETKKKKHETANVLKEVRDILNNAGQEGAVRMPMPGNDNVKVQHKKEAPKREAASSSGGFQTKTPQQLIKHVMGRIHGYKNNREQYEQLAAQANKWLAPVGDWALKQNFQDAWKLTKEERARITAAYRQHQEEWREKADMTLVEMNKDMELYRTRKEEKLDQDRERADKIISGRYRARAKDKADRISQMGLLCSALGSRVGVMAKLLMKERPVRERLKKHTKAALTLQKWMRPIIWRSKGKVIRRGFVQLKGLIDSYHVRWAIKRACKASQVVMKFTKEMSQQSEMKTAIGNFVKMVKRIQRTFRRYQTWKNYVLEVRREQFDALEATCVAEWEKRKKKIEKELNAATEPDPDKIIGDFNMRRAPHRISEGVREQLLMESFRTDQKEIEGRLLVFQASVQDYKMKIETWRSLVEAQQVVNQSKSMKQIMKDEPPPIRPPRPIVIPRLSTDDLWVMIKRGHQRMDDIVPEAT